MRAMSSSDRPYDGLTVIAALAAFLAGKERGLGHDERARLSTAGWFTLGLVMAALRITEPFLEGQSFDWSDAAMAAAILALLAAIYGARAVAVATNSSIRTWAATASFRRAASASS